MVKNEKNDDNEEMAQNNERKTGTSSSLGLSTFLVPSWLVPYHRFLSLSSRLARFRTFSSLWEGCYPKVL